MSDLISRSELIKFFKEHIRTAKDFREITINIIPTIENQPTAYDIDKVVEELELYSFEFGTDTLPAHYVRLNEATEIVKQGSVSNNVCEWELKNACYTTSIKHYYSLPSAIVKTFNNCPYCGKKIKIVGD